MEFLKEYTGGQKSSMRLNMLLATIACVIILLAVATYVIVKAFNEVEITQWTGMGVFVAGVAAVVTGVSYTKALQKKSENGNK